MIWIWVLLGAHIFLSRILPSNFLLSLCPVLVLNPHFTQAHSSIFLSCSGAQYMRLFHFLLSLCPVLVLNLCAHQRKEVRIAPQERTMIRSLIQRADKYPFKYWSGFRSTSTSRNQTKMRSTTVSITLRARTHTHTNFGARGLFGEMLSRSPCYLQLEAASVSVSAGNRKPETPCRTAILPEITCQKL